MSKQHITGYLLKEKKGISHWEVIFKNWIAVNKEYCGSYDGWDASFKYGERACIGMLAASAWRSHFIALEEFSIEKGKKHRPKWSGRADLAIISNGGQKEDLVEAKFKWVSLNAQRDITDHVTELLARASKDAANSKGCVEHIQPIACAFVAMYIPRNNAQNIDTMIKSAVDKMSTLYTQPGIHGVAWCFPKEIRQISPADLESEGYENYCPGVFMVIKNVCYG